MRRSVPAAGFMDHWIGDGQYCNVIIAVLTMSIWCNNYNHIKKTLMFLEVCFMISMALMKNSFEIDCHGV